MTCQDQIDTIEVETLTETGGPMDQFLLRSVSQALPSSGVIELKMEDYDMDDLAGEIARTLAACQDLTEEATQTGNDGGDIAVAR